MTTTDRYADLTDVRLHYVEDGEGPLVVLLHGFPDFWYSWRHQIPALAAGGFRVVAPDMRGYNLSDKPRRISEYSLDQLATDIVELIAFLGEPIARVVGHDWGGVVAWAAAAWHPDAVERVAILNAPHPDDYARGLRHPKQFLKSWYTGFFQLPGAPTILRARGFAVLTRALRWSSTEGAFTDDDLDRYVESWSQPRAIESQLAYYRAGTRRTFHNVRPLPSVDVPALVVWGERDRTLEDFFATPPVHLASQLRVARFPHATHWVHLDEPNAVNGELLAFLA